MNKILFILLRAFLTGMLFLNFAPAQQKGLELLHADKTIGSKTGGEKVSRFIGNVHFRQDTVDMYCDNAVFYEKRDKVDFVGNVRISDSKKTIWARKVEYYPDKRLAECTGMVKIKTADTEVSTDYLSYDFKNKLAVARGSLFIDDIPNKVKIWGDHGEHDGQLKYSLVNSNAKLVKIDSAATDTLVVTADRLEYFGRDSSKATALDSVTLLKGGLKAVCDTMIYMPDAEIAWLNQKPHAWYEENELYGSRMRVCFDSLEIKEILLIGQAKAINAEDSLKEKINVLKGRKILFKIKNKKPQNIISTGNASSVYYLKQDGEDQGMNQATADTISIFFKEGEVDSIRIRGGAQGVYYPGNYKGKKNIAE